MDFRIKNKDRYYRYNRNSDYNNDLIFDPVIILH